MSYCAQRADSHQTIHALDPDGVGEPRVNVGLSVTHGDA